MRVVLTATATRDRLDEQIVAVAASPRWADQVDRLGCLRGTAALTGLALSVEIGDWTRIHRLVDSAESNLIGSQPVDARYANWTRGITISHNGVHRLLK